MIAFSFVINTIFGYHKAVNTGFPLCVSPIDVVAAVLPTYVSIKS